MFATKCSSCEQNHPHIKINNCDNCNEEICVFCYKMCHFCHKKYCNQCIEDCENNQYILISRFEKTRYKVFMGAFTRITDDIENYIDKYHYSTIVYEYHLCHDCTSLN